MSTKKETKKFICEDCDSEWKLSFEKVTVSGNPEYCPFCGSPLPEDEDENYEDGEDIIMDDEDY